MCFPVYITAIYVRYDVLNLMQIMTQTRTAAEAAFLWTHLKLHFDADSDTDVSGMALTVMLVVDVEQASLKVSQWSMWLVENPKNLHSFEADVADFDTGMSVLRTLLLKVFARASRAHSLDDTAVLAERYFSLSSSHQGSFDLPITVSPVLNYNMEAVYHRSISVLLFYPLRHFKPLLFSYLSRAFPYHNIKFYWMRVTDKDPDIKAEVDLNEDGVFQTLPANRLSAIDIIVWSHGFENTYASSTVDEDEWRRCRVFEYYGQWLVKNSDINVLFMSVEGKEFSDFFGKNHLLARHMIEETVSQQVGKDDRAFGSDYHKAGILFLNPGNDASLQPSVHPLLHCPRQRADCLPPDLMMYLPTASAFMYESFDPTMPYTPIRPWTLELSNSNVLDLLMPRGLSWARARLRDTKLKRNAVAYLYKRCDRPERERFFRLLMAKDLGLSERVHALGACNGHLSNRPKFASATDDPMAALLARDNVAFSHSAVEQYKSFKFVIAFENTFVPGYMTEKLTNAYFAHAVPIYMGAPDVHDFFRRESMINCHDFASLEECAQVGNNDK
jgi:hypothetical protein